MIATRLAIAVLTAALASAASGCRANRGEVRAPDPGSAPERPRLLVAPGAMTGWSCELEVSMRLGASDPKAPFDHVSQVELEVASAHEGELALLLRSLESRLQLGPAVVAFDVDANRVRRIDPKHQEVLRGDRDPPTRAIIDALLGAPHAFVTLDEHARITAHRSDFSPVEGETLPALASLELVWMFGYPELPGDAVVGQKWIGMRTIPPLQQPAPNTIDVEVEYQLKRVEGGVATIDFAGTKINRQRATHGRYDVTGSSRVRVADGAFLGGRADAAIELAMGERTGGFGWRFESECRPPKPPR